MFKFRKKLGFLIIFTAFSIFPSFGQEICFNGIDDDNDGLIDCFDPDCFNSTYCEDFYYGPDSPCDERPPVEFDFDMILKWQTKDAYFIDQRCNAFVGDMDGDGVPDVVSKTGFNEGFIRIFDGQTGEIKQNISSLNSHPYSEPVIGDVDGNGKGDIFIIGTGGTIGRFEYGNPNPIWVTFTPNATSSIANTPQLADFDGDGYPEVYAGNRIFSAIDGTRYTIDPALNTGNQPTIPGRYSLAYDIFKPGDRKPKGGTFGNEAKGLELIVGNQVLTVELGNGSTDGGRLAIAAEINDTNTKDGFVSIADLNQDNRPDILVSSGNLIYIWNPYTESLIVKPYTTKGNQQTGRACIGNFDNDPQIELGVVSKNNLTVFDININNKTFTPKWNKVVDDESSLTTCTLFDFNGDSKNEVVYSDQEYLYILDGSTGGELSRVVCRSGTRTEYPVIADVDADGHAEIIMTCQNFNGPANSRRSFVRVYQSKNDAWMPTRKVWNQHGYFITNVNDNLTIPLQQQSHVASQLNDIFNGFLMQLSPKDINGDPIQPVPDVSAVHIETDNSNCPESISVAVQIENIGEASFPKGMPISIYKGDPFNDPTAILIDTKYSFNPLVKDGTDLFIFQIDSIIGLPADIYIVLNDNGSFTIPINLDDFPNTNILECDYSNNIIHLIMSCTEICGNGIDDDNNGLTDCEDPACAIEGSAYEITLCKPDIYEFNNQFISEAGVYLDTLPSTQAMCDSIITLTVTVNESVAISLQESICANEIFNFGNQSLSETGIYYDTTTAENNCDSITTLNLLVNESQFTQISEEICEGDYFNFGGKDYSETGIYYDTLPAMNTCDSIIELDLIVYEVFKTKIQKSICQGSSFEFGNQLLDKTGIYTEAYKTAANCDSTVELTLTIMNEVTDNINKIICQGDSYEFGDQILTTSGSYSRRYKTDEGCDILEILNLLVAENTITEINKTICEGDIYLFNNQTLDTSGKYEQQLLTIHGCDSTIILQLEINSTIQNHLSESICEGDIYLFDGNLLTESGTYSATFESNTGCDSIVHLELKVQNKIETHIDKILCDGDFINVDNTRYFTAGNYEIPLKSQSGCDSIIFLSVITGNSKIEESIIEICEGEQIEFYDDILTETGNYKKAFATNEGCDSTIILHLIVNKNEITDLNVNLCFGETYEIGNEIFDQSGIYENHFKTIKGCDSLVQLNLHIEAQLETNIEASICNDNAYFIDGETYNETGNYEYILPSQNGCDSTIYLDLTVFETYNTEIKKEICDGDFIEIDNEKFDKTGIFSRTLSTKDGCDSLVQLDLIVYPTYHTPLFESICQNDTFYLENAAYFTEGVYEILLQTQNGCDSILELEIEVFESPEANIFGVKTFCVGEELTLKASNNFKTYLWDNGSTNPIRITDQAGEYTVIVSDANDCYDTVSVQVDPPIQLETHFSFNPPFCLGVDDGNINIDSITGGKPPYIISFDGENFENTQSFTDLPPGEYPIIVSDGNKCIWEDTIVLTAPFDLDLDLEAEIELKLGDSIQLIITPNFDAKYVIWTPETGLSCSDCFDPYINTHENITYTVTAYDQNGCLAEDQLSLRIINDHNVYIPSGFTPNGDGINDVFTVYTDVNIQEVEILEIFDRWGNKVFTQSHFPANQIEFGWNGSFDNGVMNPGVFTYYTYVLFLDGKRELFKGDVTLLR